MKGSVYSMMESPPMWSPSLRTERGCSVSRQQPSISTSPRPLGHTALSEEAATCHRTQFLSGSLYSSHTASLLRLLSLFLSVGHAASLSALDQTLSKVAVCDTVDAAMAQSKRGEGIFSPNEHQRDAAQFVIITHLCCSHTVNRWKMNSYEAVKLIFPFLLLLPPH